MTTRNGSVLLWGKDAEILPLLPLSLQCQQSKMIAVLVKLGVAIRMDLGEI